MEEMLVIYFLGFQIGNFFLMLLACMFNSFYLFGRVTGLCTLESEYFFK